MEALGDFAGSLGYWIGMTIWIVLWVILLISGVGGRVAVRSSSKPIRSS